MPPDDSAAIQYIETRFCDVRGASFAITRSAARQAVRDLVRGDLLSANTNIELLGPEGAEDFRKKLNELGFAIE